PEQGWAVLVMSEIPGVELSPRSFSVAAWSSLCDLLRRIHSIPANYPPASAISRRIDEPTAFADFAETFRLHLAGLPLASERVRAHVETLTDFIVNHAREFSRPPRLIHGDINRENVRIDGATAGLIDWADLGPGDYAFDLATLKFALDSVAPSVSAKLLRDLAIEYRRNFNDDSLELRLKFYLAL